MPHSTGSANENGRHGGPGVRAGWAVYARASYAFLLAFVFPFICWGGAGQAGHPHPRSHFVFLPPPGMEILGDPLPNLLSEVTHKEHLRPTPGEPSFANATGQSTPDTLTLFVLLVVSTSFLWLLYTPTRGQKFHRMTLGATQIVPRLPLPPPRPA